MKARRSCALLLLCLLTTLAWAHQNREAITQLLFNQRTGNIEVMHRFLVHDVEHAVKELRGATADILASKQDREFFSAYVHQRFGIIDQQGRQLPLSPLGHEIEGRFLWVYAETPIPGNITALTLRHDALRDIWPRQVNLVNIERNGDVQSATFAGGAREITINLLEN